MNISICITTFNEEKSISKLLDSLLAQSLKAADIVIVDGGSKDKTVEIIRHYQKKDNRIKLLVEKCSRSRGRNLGIEIAKGAVIATTDAGCTAKPNWLKNLTEPFINDQIGAVAGFYTMKGGSDLQKAESKFLGVMPNDFDITFLPSTRSMAFRKTVWEKVGGFPESIDDTAEDTVFNYKLIKNSVKISRVKNAIVEWGMPEDLTEFYFKIRNYAKGDAKSKIWNFPGKSLMSHNIKSILILLRYVVGITLLILSIWYPYLLAYLVIGLLIYIIWSFRKVFLEFREVKIAKWGPILQVTSDFAVMAGFLAGILGR